MIVAVIGLGLLVPCAAGPAVADDLRAVDAVGAEEECLAQVIRADGPDLLAVGAGDALVVTTFFTFTRPAPCSRGENSAPVLLVPGTAESFSDRRAADRDAFPAGDAAASDRAHAQPRLGASAGGLFRAIPTAACPLHPRHSGPRGGASGRIRRCRRADAGGAGRGTHRHLALDQMVVCPSAAFFNGIGLSPATISHHMSSLVSAGFFHVDKQNPRGFNLEAARVLFWRKKSRKQVTGLSAGDSLSI